MSAGETKAVETIGYKPMILCVSEGGLSTVTHAMRRLEFTSYAQNDLDLGIGGCGREVTRPFSVFFAPIDEINCPECVAQVLGARKK